MTQLLSDSQKFKPRWYPRPELCPWWRRVLHIVLIVLGWFGYVLVWGIVLNRFKFEEQHFILLLVIVLSFVFVLFTTISWIYHCVHFVKGLKFMRKEDEFRNCPCQAQYTEDWLGRTILANWSQIQAAKKIAITISKNSKTYVGYKEQT